MMDALKTKNKKSVLVFLIASLFLFLFFLFITPVSSEDYSLVSMEEVIRIYSNGTVHVSERIEYHFTGCWHEVYRGIKLNGMNAENIKASCYGAYCRPEIEYYGDEVSISGFLYEDEESEVNELCDRDVVFYISYDLSKVVKIYSDVSEFHYKLWGEEWDESLGLLNAKIYLPSGEGNFSYWFHSTVKEKTAYNSDERFLDVTAYSIPANKFFEIRLVMPKIWFNESEESTGENVWIIPENAMPEITVLEQDYENKKTILSILSFIIPFIIILISVLFPLLIYHKYGREPRIDYAGIYERELPYNDSPAVVNAIVKEKMGKRIGKPSMEAFTSTIMDLARRGYLKISTEKKYSSELLIFKRMQEDIIIEFTEKSKNIVKDKLDKSEEPEKEDKQKIEFLGFNLLDFINMNFFEDNKITEIKINKNIGKKIKEITDFEYYSLVFLAGFSEKKEDNDAVSWHKVEEELKKKGTAKWFLEFYNDWNSLVEKHIKMNEIFIPKGDTYLKIYGALALFAGFFVFAAAASFFDEITPLIVISFILLCFSAVISLVLPEKIGGRWTPEGRTYYEKWKAFEHFITDFSQIKRYPPESVIVWEHFIVYATALGIADKVVSNMQLMLPKEEAERIGIYAHPAISASFNHAFNSGIAKANEGSGRSGGGFGGGVGGAGGGFGGGGGGAR